VFENRVLRRVFEPKRDEVTGRWRKLHNGELRDLYSLANIIRFTKSHLFIYSFILSVTYILFFEDPATPSNSGCGSVGQKRSLIVAGFELLGCPHSRCHRSGGNVA
jgi:hypothetical protein